MNTLFVLLASLVMTSILVLWLDPDFTLKVGVVYLAGAFVNTFLFRAFQPDNTLPERLGLLLFFSGMLLLAWFFAWRDPQTKPKLVEYRAFQTKIHLKVINWLG
jgi:hypothetical protein